MADPTSQRIEESLREAQHLIQRGNIEEARLLLTALQTYHPENTEVRLFLAHLPIRTDRGSRRESIWTRELTRYERQTIANRLIAAPIFLYIALSLAFPAIRAAAAQGWNSKVENRSKSGRVYYVPAGQQLMYATFPLAASLLTFFWPRKKG